MNESLRLVGPVERALFLRTLPGLMRLPTRRLAALAQNGRERWYRKGSALFVRGEPVERLVAIVDGRVRASGGGHNDELLGAQETVGLLSLLARFDQGLKALAETDTLTFELGRDALLDLYEDNFSLLLNGIGSIASWTLAERGEVVDGAYLSSWTECVECPTRGLDLIERITLLRRSPPFARSSIDALGELAGQLREVRAEVGSRLWARGDAAQHILLIVRGAVHCDLGDGRSFRCGPGYPLGNLEALATKPRWYTAEVEADLVALRATPGLVFDILEDHFEMAMDFIAAMAGHLVALREERLAGSAP